MAIKLVKGDFNSLEEALLAQIKLMQDRIDELEGRHKKWKLNKFTMDEAVYIEDKDQMMQDRIEKLEKEQEYCYHCGRHWEECCHE